MNVTTSNHEYLQEKERYIDATFLICIFREASSDKSIVIELLLQIAIYIWISLEWVDPD